MIEYGFTAFFFILLFTFILDVGWIGFNYLTFNYSYRASTWDLSIHDPDERYLRYNYNHDAAGTAYYLKEEFRKYAIGLDINRLSIENGKIRIFTEESNINKPGGIEKPVRRRYMSINADVKYTFNPATPIGASFFGKEITVVKNLTKLRLRQVKQWYGGINEKKY